MILNKISTKILLVGLILVILLNYIVVFILNFNKELPIIFSRTIEPKENVNIKTFEFFKDKMNNFDDAYWQKFCQDNTSTLNHSRLRLAYGVPNFGNYYNTFRNYDYVTSSYTADKNGLTCYSYKSIDPNPIDKIITQVFVSPDMNNKKLDIKEACGYYMNRINTAIKTVNTYQVDTKEKLYICEGSI